MFSFLSIEFALLFIAFFAVYWSLYKHPQWQNILLACTSYLIIFLMSNVLAVSLLFIYTCIIYYLSIAMESHKNAKKKILWIGIGFTLLQLSIFKYYDFFRTVISESLSLLHLDSSGLMANVIFPLGISYYSFQAISYLVSLYHHEQEVPIFTFTQLLTHLACFATITAGPIARAKSASSLTDIEQQPCGMSVQLRQETPRQILFPLLALGLILLALMKKWWFAGWLAEHWVNPIFENPMQYHSLEVLVAIYAYTLQLFLDFSGYSEMMVAFGLLLGFRLPINFRAPLLAHNIRTFWDRWHISLSTWIRDYIYIPLGGSRLGFARTQLNLLLAMGFSGIWHGSSYNFLVWGLLHGIGIILLNCSDYYYHQRHQLPMRDARDTLAKKGLYGKAFGIFITINFVAFCFVFFRATTWSEAMQVFSALCSNVQQPWTNNPYYMLMIFMIAWLCYSLTYQYANQLKMRVQQLPKVVLVALLFIAFMIIVVFAPSGIPGFIYANF